jgi:long-chain acyl-CoA synthetase
LSAKFPKEKIGSEPLDQQQNIRVLVQQELDRVNSGLASYESVKRFAILPDEFSLENGLLTPTFKVKRSEVERRYATVIDAMYAAKREG